MLVLWEGPADHHPNEPVQAQKCWCRSCAGRDRSVSRLKPRFEGRPGPATSRRPVACRPHAFWHATWEYRGASWSARTTNSSPKDFSSPDPVDARSLHLECNASQGAWKRMHRSRYGTTSNPGCLTSVSFRIGNGIGRHEAYCWRQRIAIWGTEMRAV